MLRPSSHLSVAEVDAGLAASSRGGLLSITCQRWARMGVKQHLWSRRRPSSPPLLCSSENFLPQASRRPLPRFGILDFRGQSDDTLSLHPFPFPGQTRLVR